VGTWPAAATIEHPAGVAHAPLGEACACSVVLLAALGQVVEALRGGLAGRARELHGALVHLDAGDDALLAEHLDEGGAIVRLVEQRLLVGDGAGHELAEARGGEEQLPVIPAVLLSVLHACRSRAEGACTKGGLPPAPVQAWTSHGIPARWRHIIASVTAQLRKHC
jgi:hypothetical protein